METAGGAGDQPVRSTSESDKSLQEKIEEAMQPAFDEMEGMS